MKKKFNLKLNLVLAAALTFFLACETTNQENNSLENSSKKENTENTSVTSSSKRINFEDVQISLISKSDIPSATKDFKTPYVISVKNKNGQPLEDFPISVTYPISKEDNVLNFSTKEIFTDSEGIARFLPDTISSSMNSVITFTPKASDAYQAHLAKKAALEVPFKVKFLNQKKGIMISIVDYNQNDKMVLSSSLSTSSNLLGEFWRAGFTTAQNADFHADIDKGPEAVVKSAKKLTQGSQYYKYIIFGKVKYQSPIQEVENGFSLSLKGTVTIADYLTGKEIATVEKVTTVVEKSQWNCLKECQVQLAKDLINELIFEM